MAKKGAKKILKGINCKISNKPCCGYGLGVIGAAVYYLSTATGFGVGVWGLVKAILWPAFLIFEVMKFIGA